MMLHKSMTILRALINAANGGDAETDGLQAGQIVEATGMNRITMHRLVRSLEREGLVERDDERRYHLGAQAWLLGMAANRRFDLNALAGDSLDRIEAETHDTIYLVRRVGDDVLCVARRDGTYPIKSLVMEVGKSYPLGVGGGGLAVLAVLDPAETKAVLERVRGRLDAYPKVSISRIRKLLEEARSKGYAFWPALISEALVVAVPILGPDRKPVGALSCAAIKERLTPARRARAVALLKAEAARIQLRMSGAKPGKRT
jgi:DNA-binding IclR family transcriptional regulator